jgi:hypothetical protein
MKTLPLAAFALLGLTSCQTYQYVTLSSDLEKNDRREMVIENDTVLIKYKFAGYNCPAVVHIYNKLPVPLFVDWQRSSFILYDGRNISQSNETSTIHATAVGTRTQLTSIPVTSTTYTDISGTVTKSPSIGFLPPQSFVEGTPVFLRTSFFSLPDKGLEKTITPGDGYRIWSKTFTKEETPFKFRNYITLSTNADLTDPFTFDNEFWVKKVARTSVRPQYFLVSPHEDEFYLSAPNGMGPFIFVIGVTALAAVGSAD